MPASLQRACDVTILLVCLLCVIGCLALFRTDVLCVCLYVCLRVCASAGRLLLSVVTSIAAAALDGRSDNR